SPSPSSTSSSSSGSPLACSSSSSCPSSSRCLPSSILSQSLCCSSLDCPPSHHFPSDRLQLCHSPSDCPSGSQCINSLTSSRTRMCCQSLTRSSYRRNVCPEGWIIHGPSIRACSLYDDPPQCPRGSSCLKNKGGEMYCCTPGLPKSSPFSSNPCSPGQTERLNGMVRECSIEDPICSNGFTCERTSISSFFCCSSSSPVISQQASFSCPGVGETPALSTTGSNLFCNQVGSSDTCPQNAFCRSSANSQGMLICCYSSSQITPICPSNAIPQPSINGFFSCDISLPSSQCDPGYSCVRAANDFGTQLCCSSTVDQPVCPNQGQLQQQSGRPVYCNPSEAVPCTTGYSCQSSIGSSSQFVCCSSSNSPSCPTSFTPSLDSQGSSIFCSPTEPSGCPGGSVCLPTPQSSTLYLCCRSTISPRVCPNNQNALLTSTGALETCTGPGSTCSRTGYTCQLSSVLAQWLCCGVGSTTARCADGSETYTQVTGETYTCSLLSFPSSCPTGFTCAPSSLSGTNVCCRSSGNGGCAVGWNPYRNEVTRDTKTCTAVTDESCPSGYSCTPSSSSSSSTSSFLCCRLADSPRCPSSSTYLLNSQPRLCSSSKLNQCPIGYQCTSSTVPSISICCSSSPSSSLPSVTCPDGSSPALLNSMPRYCPTPGSTDGCPLQFICLSLNQMNVCCRRSNRQSRSLLLPLNRSFPISRSIINPCGLAADPLIHNNSTVYCFNQPSICPTSHPCRQSPSSADWFCCQEAQCPNGVRVGAHPAFCSSNDHCNNANAVCTDALNMIGLRICCSLPSSPLSRCLGRSTQLRSGRPVSCLLGSICEYPFVCSSLTSDSSPLCCENERDSVSICPDGRIPLRSGRSDEVVFCGGREPQQVCLHGFECLRAKADSRSVCCSEQPSCPNGRTGLVGENNEIKRCFISSPSECSTGFQCSDSSIPHIFLCCQSPPSTLSNSSQIPSDSSPLRRIDWLQIEPAH
ncbi:hypothetical protein PENTCL1PPCAC_6546, partial [Pristionchus entomophagus]